MDEQMIPEVYVPPMLVEVGEFSEDTLGFKGTKADHYYFGALA